MDSPVQIVITKEEFGWKITIMGRESVIESEIRDGNDAYEFIHDWMGCLDRP